MNDKYVWWYAADGEETDDQRPSSSMKMDDENEAKKSRPFWVMLRTSK